MRRIHWLPDHRLKENICQWTWKDFQFTCNYGPLQNENCGARYQNIVFRFIIVSVLQLSSLTMQLLNNPGDLSGKIDVLRSKGIDFLLLTRYEPSLLNRLIYSILYVPEIMLNNHSHRVLSILKYILKMFISMENRFVRIFVNNHHFDISVNVHLANFNLLWFKILKKETS